MQRDLRWYEFITLNVYHFGLSTVSQTIAPLVAPLLIQQYVGEAQKATYYGNLRLWGLMVALLAQALWGLLSDRSATKWGKRRPFIFWGSWAVAVMVLGIGWLGNLSLSGMSGYWLLFIIYLILQICFNAGQAAAQGFIPDLVPEQLVGRASALKSLLEVPLPVILVSFVIAPMIGNGNILGSSLLAAGVLILTMLLTMTVKEKPLSGLAARLDWQPFLRLVLMTAFFTIAILGMGEAVKLFEALLGKLNSLTTALVVIGAVGLAGMLVAIVLGVWVSLRISLGGQAQKASFLGWVMGRLAFMVGVFGLSSFAVYFLQGRFNLVQEQAAKPAARLLLFVGVTVLIFALAGGWLADRFPRKRLVALAGWIAALGTLIAVLAPGLSLVYVGGCFIGAATGLFYTSSWALGVELVPKNEAGRFLGLSNLAGAGAGAVGAYIGGPIADYFTVHAPNTPGLGYVLLFAIFGVLFLLSSAPLAWVKEGWDAEKHGGHG